MRAEQAQGAMERGLAGWGQPAGQRGWDGPAGVLPTRPELLRTAAMAMPPVQPRVPAAEAAAAEPGPVRVPAQLVCAQARVPEPPGQARVQGRAQAAGWRPAASWVPWRLLAAPPLRPPLG